MSVTIKTQHEIELMRESGHLLEKVHDGLIPYIKPGVSTKEIDRIGEDMIRSMGCIPNFLNYGGFPALIYSYSPYVIHIIHILKHSLVLHQNQDNLHNSYCILFHCKLFHIFPQIFHLSPHFSILMNNYAPL